MTRTLLPRWIHDAYLGGATRGTLQAIGLFVDVSGFTAMSERVMRHGRLGAELLAEALQGLFEPMVVAIEARGGHVVGFAGDACTAVFPAAPDAAERAYLAALAIRDAVRDAPPRRIAGEDFSFAVKLGLASGQVTWQVMGRRDGRRVVVVRGGAIDKAAAAERRAAPGQVVLDPDLELPPTGDAPPAKDAPAWRCDPEVLRAIFPEVLLDETLPGELRWVASAYVNVRDWDGDDDVERFVQVALDLAERYGGHLARVYFADKGFSLLLYWGAPRNQERDVERALSFLLDLRERSRRGDVGVFRAGVTHRLMYSGFVGGRSRSEYTCYGRGVTLAARLMTKAPWGALWAGERVLEAADETFELLELAPVELKGYPAPQPVARLVGRREHLSATAPRGALVGRDEELRQLRGFLDPLREGQSPGVFAVLGAPGVGKSRLIAELRRTRAAGTRWLGLACEAVRARSHGPFRMLVRHVLEVPEHASRREQLRRLEAGFDELLRSLERRGDAGQAPAAQLRRTRPMLVGLLDLAEPDAPWARLRPGLRRLNLQQAVAALVEALCLAGPVVLHIDDVQWLDEDSRGLLDHLARRCESWPLALLLSARLADDGSRPPAVTSAATRGELLLSGLSRSASAALAERELGRAPGAELRSLIDAKTDGNPLFVEQFVRELSEAGHLELRRGQLVFAGDTVPELPASLDGLLVSRLDRLAAPVRRTVQIAAVLGATFQASVLRRLAGREVQVELDEAATLSVLEPLERGGYRFRHALLRDAAYQMQASAELRERHRGAALALEAEFADQLAGQARAIAHHHAEGGDDTAAITWLDRARAHASSTHDYAAKLDVCSELRRRTSRRGEEGERQLYWESLFDELTTLEDLGQAERAARVGETELGRNADDVAARLLAEGPHARERLLVLLRLSASRSTNPAHRASADEALHVVERRARELGDRWAQGRAAIYLADSLTRSGQLEASLEASARAQALFEELGDDAYVGACLHNQARVHGLQGRVALARSCFEQARDRFVASGSRNFEANALGALANLEGQSGSPARAHEALVQARRAYTEIGLDVVVGTCFSNESQIWSEQGEVAEAWSCIHAAEEVLGAEPPPARAVHLLVTRAQAHEAAGELEQARSCCLEAAAGGEALGQPYLVLHAHRRLGRVLRALGRPGPADELLETTRAAALDGDFRQLAAAMATEQAELALDAGNLDRAAELLDQAHGVLGAAELSFELCRCLAARGRLALARGDVATAQQLAHRADEMCEQLELRPGGWVLGSVEALHEALDT